MSNSSRAILAALVLAPVVAGAQVRQASSSTAPQLTPQLSAVRSALDKYQDPLQAVRDGYFSTLGCVAYPVAGGHGEMAYQPGGMGVHFINMGNVGPTLDSLKPQVLIYEPVGDRLQLAAAEWFVPAQLAATAPAIFGQSLQGPMDGHAPIMPAELRHWDLHVWLWKSNPSGTFSPTNPDLKCPAGPYTFEERAPAMHDHQ